MNEAGSTFGSLVEILQFRAREQGGCRAFTFLREGEEEEARFTFAELDARAKAIGARLLAEGARGERVLLLYPSGLEFIAAFMGCLYAGAVAVPAHLPRGRANLGRLRAVAESARPRLALSTRATLPRLEPPLAEVGLGALRCLASDEIPGGPDIVWREPLPARDGLAFLQYTSGSTAQPKGVMVTHGNLIANHRMLQTAMGQTERSTFVIWLPLFHDMGLIGNALQAIFLGAHAVLIPPEAFLVKPFRWLRAISRYRAHTSGGPNFAYDLCARRITAAQRAELDLSSWKVAFNGAEPVRQATLERFARAFAPCGLERSTLFPCYGLAEATLYVSGGAWRGEEAPAVSCGVTEAGAKMVAVELDTRRLCVDGEEGEIWLAGPHVAQGYWSLPAATEETFGARLAETGDGPYLRTGDLGFVRDGELFITGRRKELIIVAGRNIYPQDLERTVEGSHPALEGGCCAVFGVQRDGEERVAVAAEVNRSSRRDVEVRAIETAIQASLAEEHGLRAEAVLVLRPGSVPKTSSGKIQRLACQEAYLAGELRGVMEIA